MIFKLLTLIFLTSSIYADRVFESVYFVTSRDINLSTITNDTKNDSILFSIEKKRYSHKIPTKELVKIVEMHGYKDFGSKSRYINFVLKNNFDTSLIEKEIKTHYEQNYKELEIKNITITPRAEIESLPNEFVVNLDKKSFLSRKGVVGIKAPNGRKFFFEYDVNANLFVYISKDIIKKDTHISLENSLKKSITLERFKAKPLQNLSENQTQAKHNIPKETILTVRDIVELSVIKKDAQVTINISKDDLALTTTAKALEDGKIGDIIKVQNSSKKNFKVKVIGINMAELE